MLRAIIGLAGAARRRVAGARRGGPRPITSVRDAGGSALGAVLRQPRQRADATTSGAVDRSPAGSPRRRTRTGAASMRSPAIERVREIGFRANGLAYIPRRYCVAPSRCRRSAPSASAAAEDAHGRLQRGRERAASSAGAGASSGASSVSTASTPTRPTAPSCGRSSSAGSASRRSSTALAEYGLKAPLSESRDGPSDAAVARSAAVRRRVWRALGASPRPAPAGRPPVATAPFDYYVMTLSWSPGFCDLGGEEKSPRPMRGRRGTRLRRPWPVARQPIRTRPGGLRLRRPTSRRRPRGDARPLSRRRARGLRISQARDLHRPRAPPTISRPCATRATTRHPDDACRRRADGCIARRAHPAGLHRRQRQLAADNMAVTCSQGELVDVRFCICARTSRPSRPARRSPRTLPARFDLVAPVR